MSDALRETRRDAYYADATRDGETKDAATIRVDARRVMRVEQRVAVRLMTRASNGVLDAVKATGGEGDVRGRRGGGGFGRAGDARDRDRGTAGWGGKVRAVDRVARARDGASNVEAVLLSKGVFGRVHRTRGTDTCTRLRAFRSVKS